MEPSLATYYFKAVSKSSWDQKIAYYNKIIEQNLKDPDAYFIRGYIYSNYGPRAPQLGILDKAIADYTKILEIDPGYKKAYINRGDVYEEVGNLEKACSDWKKAFELGDRTRWSIKNRIRCLGK